MQGLEPRRLLAATLIQDLDPRPGNDLRPTQIAELDGVAYFSHADAEHGLELWRSDGTPGGTWIVKDIDPGRDPSAVGAVLESIVAADGLLYFSASDGEAGHELWKSDGTEGGTVLVADIRPGATSSYPQYLVAAGSGVYFFANDGASGIELWHSDGTPEGTSIVTDLRPGPTGQVPRLGTVAPDGSFFFYGTNGAPNSTGSGLWKTDGTAAGTLLLKSGAQGLLTSSTPMTTSGGYTYVADAVGGLWRSDGTPAGTVEVEEGHSLTGYVTEMEDVAGRLYYVRAINPSSNPAGALWVRTGDNATRVTDTASINGFTNARSLTHVNGSLYFAASTNSAGSELWRANPATTAATMVRDATPGVTGTTPLQITHVGSTVYFTAGTAASGYSLWRSNGTSAGTTSVAPLNPGTPLEAPAELTALAGRVVFVNDTAAAGPELWASAGSAATTGIVADIYPGTRWSQPFFWGALGDTVLFNASTAATGIELFATDGTPGGITLLADINPGATGTNPGALRLLGDVAYFTAHNAATGSEPWVTDGTPGGTRQLLNVRPGSVGSEPGNYVRLGDTVFFTADDGAHGYELWKTDGTAEGTAIVKDIVPGTSGSSPSDLVVSGGRLYFTATTPAAGAELWVSDGTEAGTALFKDIRPGATGSAPGRFADVGGKLYFAANGGAGSEPWTSDGTPEGTVQLKDIRGGSADSSPAQFTAAGGVVYFFAADATAGQELWKTDGTTAGTTLVKDVRAGTGGGALSSLTAIHDRVFFIGDDGAAGRELWTSTGTAASTVMLKDIYPGTGLGVLTGLTVANGRLFFAGDDSQHGYEIWTTDGTPGGTTMVQDLNPGFFSGTRGRPIAGPGGTLYWEGNDGVSGFEPFKMEDSFAPYLWGGRPGATPGHAVVMRFNEPVSHVDAGAFRLLDGTGAEVAVGAVRVSYDPAAASATFEFPDLPGGRLPAGEYVAVLDAGAAYDAAGNASTDAFRLPVAIAAPSVAGRHAFYNNSALDGWTAAAGAADDMAIAGDKQALLSGDAATARNVTSSSRGINGIMVDVAGLPGAVTLTADDFILSTGDGSTWSPASTVSSVTVRRGAGSSGSDRVTLILPDGTARNGWLRVTVKANANTGLAAPDVFYFGNLVGDAGGPGAPTVNATDLARTRANLGRTSAAALTACDFDRDGAVTAADLLIARQNQRRTLRLFTAPAVKAAGAGPTPAAANPPAPPSTSRRIARRAAGGLLGAATPDLLD